MIEEIEITLVVLALITVMFILFRLYRKLKIVRSGSPKSRIVYSRQSGTEDKPKTSQVIGMIKCEYCGSLMPQTATVGSNCGASRKK